jgi:thymidylate synthase (FAD)
MEDMMTNKVTILRGEPTIVPVAEMQLITLGVEDMIEWVKLHRPACLPDVAEGNPARWDDLFPHKGLDENTGRELTANELLVELAGRKCYDSFGAKAGRKSNKEYIESTQAGEVPHASIMYHAKMSFFVAGISRRVSHEIIRNYVGADRSEEGSPSQESTRFTHHYGFFIEPPRYKDDPGMQAHFEQSMQAAYENYMTAVQEETHEHAKQFGKQPTSMDRKRIYEAASSFLPHQAETSFIWTTNPAAIAKFVRERDNPLADLEIQRFARAWKRLCVARWPNLFNCYPWMQESKE